MKSIVIVVVILLLVGGAGAFYYVRSANAAAAASAAASASDQVKVSRRTVRLSVMAYGAVASNKDVDIKCKASGEILELPYDVSDLVPQGSLLLRLDTIDEENSLNQAKAVVAADQAKLIEAQYTFDAAKLALVTTRERDEAALAAAQAKAKDARSKAERTKELFDGKLASEEDLETAETTAASADSDVQTAHVAIAELEQEKIAVQTKEQDIDLAKSQLAQDQIKQAIALQNVEYCTVYAPVHDRWLQVQSLAGAEDAANITPAPDDAEKPLLWTVKTLGTGVQLHTIVQSGTSSVSGGTTVMTLSDFSRIFVLATVDESDIGRVRPGQEVRITADAYPGVQFSGVVIRRAPAGVLNNNVVTVEVKIEVTSPNKDLLKIVQMTANVEIILAEKKDALVLPVLAVSRQHEDEENDGTETGSAGASATPATASASSTQNAESAPPVGEGPFPATVQLMNADGSVETRNIQVGMNDGVDYVVLSGLKEGDTVLLSKLAKSKWRSVTAPVRPKASKHH